MILSHFESTQLPSYSTKPAWQSHTGTGSLKAAHLVQTVGLKVSQVSHFESQGSHLPTLVAVLMTRVNPGKHTQVVPVALKFRVALHYVQLVEVPKQFWHSGEHCPQALLPFS